MEEVKKLLEFHNVPNPEVVAELAYEIHRIIDKQYEYEDIISVAEDMGIDLSAEQVRKCHNRWQVLETYGELDREGIECAIRETIKES